MTHSELIDLTAKKIQRLFGCGLILKEPTTSRLNMSPDVFAVKKGGISFQFEIKTSLSDFLKDKNKPHRKDPSLDVGMYRYYVAPKGVIKPEHNDIINNPAIWGIIEVSKGGQFSFLRGPNPRHAKLESFDNLDNPFRNTLHDYQAEMELVYSYYQSLVINSFNNPIEVKSIAERLCNDANELIDICKRVK